MDGNWISETSQFNSNNVPITPTRIFSFVFTDSTFMNNDVVVVTGADVRTPMNVDLGGRLVVNPFVTTAVQHIVIIIVNMILFTKYIILLYVCPI